MREHRFWTYIMASNSGTLHIGVTDDLRRRVYEHKIHFAPGFTKEYDCRKLVHFEEYQWIQDAIQREKQLKGWKREKKQLLIEKMNPGWRDLAIDMHLSKIQ